MNDPLHLFRVAGIVLTAAMPLACARASHDKPLAKSAPAPTTSPSIQDVIASKIALWGEAALRQPDGPSYEYFAALLPPLRYVDAPFLHYPIVLSGPNAPVKG